MPRNNYVRREPRGCPLTPRQWRRLDIVETVDGIPVKESIERACQIKLTWGRATSVWVTEYLKRWKADFDTRPLERAVAPTPGSESDTGKALGGPLTSAVKKLVGLAWD